MADVIRQTLLFPIIQSIHLMALAALVGAIALVDLRRLGLGLLRVAANDLATQLAPWTKAGLIAVAATGPLLFVSDSSRYVKNPAFLLKMGLLAVALVSHLAGRHARRPKLAVAISLALWSSVILAGRAIADFDIYPD